MSRYFITGTDTDAGKTLVTAALLTKARRQGRTTLGLKPVAAGCVLDDEGLRNADARLLQMLTHPQVGYSIINPVAFEAPIAPHLAALQAGRTIHLAELDDAVRPLLSKPYDLVLIEGAGGWRVPLNRKEDLSGLAVRLDLPVILVVGLRLGCINHARLTLEAIRADGLAVAGWVATRTDRDMHEYEASLATLRDCLDAPCLGSIPWLGDTSHGDRDASLNMAERASCHLRLPGAN